MNDTITEIRKKVRPLYSELKGYLQVAPEDHTIFDDTAVSLEQQLNGTIEELALVTGQDFSKFKISCRNEEWNRQYRTTMKSLEYRNKLSGLINKLQGEFFSEEQYQTGNPSTIINTHQNQSQSQQQTIIVDIAMMIAEKKASHKEGTPERDFLDKSGEMIKSTSGVTDIIKNIISIASSCGLTLASLAKIFGAI